MKSTGVVKKIDDLGRVVIPKELRRILNIRDGEILELFVSDQDLIIKKHSSLEGTLVSIKRILDLITNNNIGNALLVNREGILLSTIEDRLVLSDECILLIEDRVTTLGNSSLFVDYNNELGKYLYFIPLITDIDCVGGLILGFDTEVDESKIKLSQFISSLIIEILQ